MLTANPLNPFRVSGMCWDHYWCAAVLQNDLHKRQAEQIVGGILDEILEGIQSPDRPCSPIDAHITEEEVFSRKNTGVGRKHCNIVVNLSGLSYIRVI